MKTSQSLFKIQHFIFIASNCSSQIFIHIFSYRRDHLRSKLKDQNLTDEDIEHIKNMIEIVEDEANKIKFVEL